TNSPTPSAWVSAAAGGISTRMPSIVSNSLRPIRLIATESFCKEPTDLTSLAYFSGACQLRTKPSHSACGHGQSHIPPSREWMHPTRGNVGGNLSGNLDSVSGGAKTTRSRSQNSRKSDSHAEHYWVKVAGFFQAASFSQHRNLTWPSSRR